jgi:hypothetical protein
MGKGSRKKPRKHRKPVHGASVQRASGPATVDSGQRPTEWRRRFGVWADPTGSAKSTQPTVDLAADEIGKLHVAGKITDAQEQAARTFQELRRAFLGEFGLRSFKSCIAGGVPHYDDGDGDPAIKEQYQNLEAKLSFRERSELLHVADDNHPPRALPVLRAALDKVAGT